MNDYSSEVPGVKNHSVSASSLLIARHNDNRKQEESMKQLKDTTKEPVAYTQNPQETTSNHQEETLSTGEVHTQASSVAEEAISQKKVLGTQKKGSGKQSKPNLYEETMSKLTSPTTARGKSSKNSRK